MNGTMRSRSHSASSSRSASGKWFVASQGVHTGWNSKYSLNRNRAVILSPPVTALMLGAQNRCSLSVSRQVTSRAPFSRATSLGILEVFLARNVSAGVDRA